MNKASANSKMAGFLLIALIGSACILWIAFSGIGEIITSLQSLEIDDEKKSALIKLVNANNVWSLIFGGVIISGIVLFILFQYRPLLKGINNTIEILDNPKQTQVIENLKLASTQAGHSAIRHTQQLLTNHLEDVQQRISNVNDTVSGCSETTAQLSTDVTQVANSVNDQNQELEQIATAINQMSATIHEVARNMSKAADAASKLKEDAQSGAVQATAAIGAIANLDQQVNSNADTIDEVHTETTNINVLIDVINGIADQTNLLALNAAIEAARAGEQGRGFAVVADEVRVLATRTSESTQEIETMLTSLLTKSSAAVESMQKAKGQAEHSGNSVADAAAALANISGEIKNIDEMNLQVASAMEEQSVVAEEINQKVQNISNLTNHVDLDIKKISEASEKLLEQVTHFKKLVS